MIEEITDKKAVETILKKHFESYHTTSDPFEKIVVYKDPDIIGLISYSIIYERAEINYIVVNKDKRKKHIGTKLLTHALEDIKNKNIKTVSLEVLEDNIPAINLYLKNGFITKAIRKNYHKEKSAYLMIKELR